MNDIKPIADKLIRYGQLVKNEHTKPLSIKELTYNTYLLGMFNGLYILDGLNKISHGQIYEGIAEIVLSTYAANKARTALNES